MSEELKSVSEMIRLTANNTKMFMDQVAVHVEQLEATIAELMKRVEELEGKDTNNEA